VDGFFAGSAQFVYRGLCRAIAGEFGGGPVSRVDKGVHDGVAHFGVEFGVVSAVGLTSSFEGFGACFAHVCSLCGFVCAKVFVVASWQIVVWVLEIVGFLSGGGARWHSLAAFRRPFLGAKLSRVWRWNGTRNGVFRCLNLVFGFLVVAESNRNMWVLHR
jgi:hypothetical protein